MKNNNKSKCIELFFTQGTKFTKKILQANFTSKFYKQILQIFYIIMESIKLGIPYKK